MAEFDQKVPSIAGSDGYVAGGRDDLAAGQDKAPVPPDRDCVMIARIARIG